jgi:anti-anti-sigma factor
MNPSKFTAQVRREAGLVTLDLAGEINGFAEAALNEAYTDAESNDPALIALNFTSISYINSTGIALIVGLLARARKARRQLAAYGLSDHYSEVFQITRLSDFMQIVLSEADLKVK